MRPQQLGYAESAIAAGRPPRAAIYNRVSKDRAGRQRSVEEQEAENREDCADIGAVIEGVYTDNDRSASKYATKPRQEWERLLKDLDAGRYDLVVLWEVSRGDRDDLGFLTFLRMAQKVGLWIHITSHGQTFDPRKDHDYQALRKEAMDGADESARTSKRILRTTRATAKKGRPHGPVAYGYRREYELGDDGKRQIRAQLPDVQERTATGADGATCTYTRVGIVEEVYRRLLAGEAARAVAIDLNRRGIPSPGGSDLGWLHTTVADLARNPVYAGLRARNGEIVAKAIWPPLVSEPDFYTLRARLGDPSRRKQRDTTIKYLGSGLWVCQVCRSTVRVGTRQSYTCWPTRMRGQKSESKSRDVTGTELAELHLLSGDELTARVVDLWLEGVTQASVARGLGMKLPTLNRRVVMERRRRGIGPETAGQAKGFHVARRVDDVDTFVQRAVWLRLSRPDFAVFLAEDDRVDAEFEALTGEIAGKQARLDQAADAFSAGGLSLTALQRIEATLEPEIKAARAKLTQARVGPVLDGLVLPNVEDVEAAWWLKTLPERREVIRALIERVEILPLPKDRKHYTVEESVRIVWRKTLPAGPEATGTR